MHEKIKFEILRDEQRRPTVTICTIAVNGDIGMGVAIRSQNDNPVERIGKIKAYGRAKKALYRRKDSMPIFRDEALESIETVGWRDEIVFYKSVYMNA